MFLLGRFWFSRCTSLHQINKGYKFLQRCWCLLQTSQVWRKKFTGQKVLWKRMAVCVVMAFDVSFHWKAVVEEICQGYPTLIIPHPGECQLYYNCSLTYTSVPAHLEQHMVECNYPDLFSEKTNRCENFTDVCCGARKEIKNKCKIFLISWKLTRQYCVEIPCMTSHHYMNFLR